ncbi:MAG: Holliday junction branch migration protein RuvA [Elusimicrobiota bacterium]|jgi:Holliday junction DNA helicase RuvA|nr:Holliday junction branch migration protein RuvA [Elusimicrobiota bacterium]
MIDYINGILKVKLSEAIVVEAGGIGYKIFAPHSTLLKLPKEDSDVKIYIVEAVAGIYGGVINLYGFLTYEEREMYLLIKDEVPGTGAKKALEYTDKVSKSFVDFKTAVLKKNSETLCSTFGFTKKTADKLIAALKEKILAVNIAGEQEASFMQPNTVTSDAVMALISLGIKEIHAKRAVNKAFEDDRDISLEDLIKKSLKYTR